MRRAHLILNSKEGGYLKARDLALRHEQQCTSSSVPQQSGLLSLSLSSASSSDPQQKKLKELEKKRKNEEDALNRVCCFFSIKHFVFVYNVKLLIIIHLTFKKIIIWNILFCKPLEFIQFCVTCNLLDNLNHWYLLNISLFTFKNLILILREFCALVL